MPAFVTHELFGAQVFCFFGTRRFRSFSSAIPHPISGDSRDPDLLFF